MVPFVSTRARPFRRDSVACASKIVEYFVAGEMSFISSRHPLVVALVPAMRRCWSCAKHVVKYSSPQADEEPALAVSAFSRRGQGYAAEIEADQCLLACRILTGRFELQFSEVGQLLAGFSSPASVRMSFPEALNSSDQTQPERRR